MFENIFTKSNVKVLNNVRIFAKKNDATLFVLLVEMAVQISHGALFTNNGQVCCAGSRVFVHEDIYDDFVAKSVEMAIKSKVTNPMESDADNGSMVRIF